MVGFRRKDRGLRQQIGRMRALMESGYELDGRGKLVHRKICRQAHGWFPANWVVHHLDEVKTNNVPENLIALPRKLHNAVHLAARKLRRCLTRGEIETMLKSNLNLRKNQNRPIIINLPIEEKKEEPKLRLVEEFPNQKQTAYALPMIERRKIA